MSDNPEELRARSVRLYAMALRFRDEDPGHADRLVAEAIDLQDQATTIEEAARIAPASPGGRQGQVQQQQQIQRKKPD